QALEPLPVEGDRVLHQPVDGEAPELEIDPGLGAEIEDRPGLHLALAGRQALGLSVNPWAGDRAGQQPPLSGPFLLAADQLFAELAKLLARIFILVSHIE